MEVLVISDSKKLKEFLSFQLSSQLPVIVKESTSKSAVELVSESPSHYAVAVLPYSGPDSAILASLKAHNPQLPTIFYFDPMISDPDPTDFEGIRVLGTVEVSALVAGTLSLIKKYIDDSGIHLESMMYCPIRTSLLLQTSPVLSDIYIRLSQTKFVKIFNSGDDFDSDDLKKYASKDIEYLFLPRNSANAFVSQFQGELDKMLARTDLNASEAMDVVANTQDTIQQLLNIVGFTEEVQKVAKKNVQLALKAIGKNPKLSMVLSRIQSAENYIAEHSALLAEVACCLAKEVEWESDATFGKLVLAALMHDISVMNPRLAKVNTLSELQDRKGEFLPVELATYNLHPMKSADVVKSFKEIPPDVDVIVAQHHELPDGKGFPRGLTFSHIAPLSVVFIIAHDITQEILEKREAFTLVDFVKAKRTKYESGVFKKVIMALDKADLGKWMPDA